MKYFVEFVIHTSPSLTTLGDVAYAMLEIDDVAKYRLASIKTVLLMDGAIACEGAKENHARIVEVVLL